MNFEEFDLLKFTIILHVSFIFQNFLIRCSANFCLFLCYLCLFPHEVSVGYEYESCASLILWEKRTAFLQGYELDPSSLGGWSLDKHHILNTRSGTFNVHTWILYFLFYPQMRTNFADSFSLQFIFSQFPVCCRFSALCISLKVLLSGVQCREGV